jgi:hypothetical protein
MKVKQLIEKLQKLNQDAEVQIEYSGRNGCDTCGYGAEEQSDVENVYDLQNKVVLSAFCA